MAFTLPDRDRALRLVAAASSGAILEFVSPPIGLHFLQWFAFVPLNGIVVTLNAVLPMLLTVTVKMTVPPTGGVALFTLFVIPMSAVTTGTVDCSLDRGLPRFFG